MCALSAIKRFSYSKIMHLTSEVEGRLREGLDALDAVKAFLRQVLCPDRLKFRPAGLLRSWKRSPGVFMAGAIGYLDFTGNMDICIAIRMAVKKGNKVYVQAGGGIVAGTGRSRNMRKQPIKPGPLWKP